MFWATATMTSIGFGDIVPLTDVEKGMALFVMILGASAYGGLFGTFVALIDSVYEHNRETNTKIE